VASAAGGWLESHRSAYGGMRVCVTGGAGFIGSHLVEALDALGAHVTVLDDLCNGFRDNLKGRSDRVRLIEGSILDADAMSRAAEGAAVIFHLAALGSVPRSVEEPMRYHRVNVDGTLAVLEQDDTCLVRLYRADPRPATDTLPRTRRGDAPAVETIGDLAAAGIVPLEKTLLADLAPLVPRFRADVHGGDGAGGGASLKLEGLTVLGERRILLANDNDFAVPGSTGGGTAARSCVWVVELPSALPPHEALTVDR